MKTILSVIVALLLIIIAILAVPTLVTFIMCALFSIPFAWNYVIAAFVMQLWLTGIVKAAGNVK